jgi:hypothetical protein
MLKIVRELVTRLIQLNVIRAGHDHHDHAAVLAFLDRAATDASFITDDCCFLRRSLIALVFRTIARLASIRCARLR